MLQQQFPIYIPSKGRAESRLTVKALDSMHVTDYRVIVEQQQFDDYAKVIAPHHLLVLDPQFQDDYDPCDKLGRTLSLGPGPARNAAWAHSIERGADWHWVMDDNILHFYWRRANQKLVAADPGYFLAMEDFCLRYRNVAMAGPNYHFFAKSRQDLPPFITGTRIFSCNLIRNDVPLRWRARYNEDTDLSLRMLKAGWNTVQFNAFLQGKMNTQTMSGGNTDEFYAKQGTAAKSEMLRALHPDVTTLRWRFGRAHHTVNYGRWLGRVPLVPAPNPPAPRNWNVTVTTAPKKATR